MLGLNIIFIGIPVCENGYYGSNCSKQCGHCLNGQPCDKHIGFCDKGCQPHFQSPLCQGSVIHIEFFVHNSNKNINNRLRIVILHNICRI